MECTYVQVMRVCVGELQGKQVWDGRSVWGEWVEDSYTWTALLHKFDSNWSKEGGKEGWEGRVERTENISIFSFTTFLTYDFARIIDDRHSSYIALRQNYGKEEKSVS